MDIQCIIFVLKLYTIIVNIKTCLFVYHLQISNYIATELQQPAGKQTHQFCIYTVKAYWYATVSLLTVRKKNSLNE